MKKILINENPWQTRVAITENEKIQGLYFSSHAIQTLERAYFKGTVTKVLPGIQTAFVDIGQEKAGFLHISEIDRELAIERISKTTQLDEEVYIKREQVDITKILKEGEPILVQVSKEPIYEKGAKLTTCFTLPGRFIVLMPNIPRIGVSKKIENREERFRLKEIVQKKLPEGMGAIIRTTSEDRGEKEISKDISFLVETWNEILEKYKTAKPHEKLYEDLDIPLQIVRDHLDEDVSAVIIDNAEQQKKIYRFIKTIAPEFSHTVMFYDEKKPLFEHFGIEKQIEQALEKKVPLKSGGSLIIESTEAMTVVDVNTGKFVGKTNLEDTIFKTNMEAAEEIVRQLRLRNIGGLIVIDFIDMAIISNRQKLFKFFEKTLKERDRHQSVVLKISEFGLVQMTRKRVGTTLIQQLTDTCPHCRGLGVVKSIEEECYALLRAVNYELKTGKMGAQIAIHVHPQVLHQLTDVEYNAILGLEKNYGCKITLVSQKSFKISQYKIEKK
jgi:ribonuclease G